MTTMIDNDLIDSDIPGIDDEGGGGDTPYHTILQVWRAVLEPAERERLAQITPQWANRICATYREIYFSDMPRFRDLYFDKIAELSLVLEAEIDSDVECLNKATPEEDVEENGHHYLNLLIDWQRLFLQWELDWEPDVQDAAIEIAAMAEIHKMFFDQTGLTSLLDNIRFEITDDDRDLMGTALQELKDSREG